MRQLTEEEQSTGFSSQVLPMHLLQAEGIVVEDPTHSVQKQVDEEIQVLMDEAVSYEKMVV